MATVRITDTTYEEMQHWWKTPKAELAKTGIKIEIEDLQKEWKLIALTSGKDAETIGMEVARVASKIEALEWILEYGWLDHLSLKSTNPVEDDYE